MAAEWTDDNTRIVTELFAEQVRMPTIPERYKRYAVPTSASDSSTSEASGRDMDEFRDQLATAIALGW